MDVGADSDVLVIGAGLAGVAAAVAAQDAGLDVRVIDRGRRPGGRMASRRLRETGTDFDGRVVDHGASYFTVRDADFTKVVNSLIDRGVVRPWTDTFHVYSEGAMSGVRTGPMRYAATGGLRTVVETLAEDVTHIECDRHVDRVEIAAHTVSVEGQSASSLALCMPQPQAEGIVPPGVLPDVGITWEPVIAVTLVFEQQEWIDLDGVFVNDDPIITWIADDGSRRGDAAPVLVAHVNPVFAAGHLDDPSGVLPQTIAAVRRVLDIDPLPVWTWAHRWSLAKPIAALDEDCWLHPELPVGLAGDAWAGGPRVEAAWLSGRALGRALAVRHSS